VGRRRDRKLFLGLEVIEKPTLGDAASGLTALFAHHPHCGIEPAATSGFAGRTSHAGHKPSGWYVIKPRQTQRLICGTIRSTVAGTQARLWRIAHGPDLA
jgi:hypothetical protein